MRKVFSALGVLLAAGVLLIGCQPESHACGGVLAMPEQRLNDALKSSLAAQTSIKEVIDSDAGAYKRYIENALRRTFSTDIPSAATAHGCAVYGSGEYRFSVHAFSFKSLASADSIRQMIAQRKANTLKIEALTYYELIAGETTLLFFVADRESYAQYQPVFQEVRRRYQSN
jgi:hypothetical protein